MKLFKHCIKGVANVAYFIVALIINPAILI